MLIRICEEKHEYATNLAINCRIILLKSCANPSGFFAIEGQDDLEFEAVHVYPFAAYATLLRTVVEYTSPEP